MSPLLIGLAAIGGAGGLWLAIRRFLAPKPIVVAAPVNPAREAAQKAQEQVAEDRTKRAPAVAAAHEKVRAELVAKESAEPTEADFDASIAEAKALLDRRPK